MSCLLNLEKFYHELSVDMIYDDDVKLFGKDKISPALQVKSIIVAVFN